MFRAEVRAGSLRRPAGSQFGGMCIIRGVFDLRPEMPDADITLRRLYLALTGGLLSSPVPLPLRGAKLSYEAMENLKHLVGNRTQVIIWS